MHAVSDPLGQITARWKHLSLPERDRHARRIVGVGLSDARIDRPDASCHHHYTRLLAAAVAGDPVAIGWLADSHRPLLLTRGRVLFEQDPAEWGAASLEILLAAAHAAQAGAGGPWLRRQVNQQITRRIRPLTTRELARRRFEQTCDPGRLLHLQSSEESDPHPQLTDVLDRALGELDRATSAGLRAVAMRRPLAPVAVDHELTHAALKQRVARARRRLRPQLATFARTV